MDYHVSYTQSLYFIFDIIVAPDHDLFEHHPTVRLEANREYSECLIQLQVNSELLNLLRLGRIVPHVDVLEIIEGTKVVKFVDGKEEEVTLLHLLAADIENSLI